MIVRHRKWGVGRAKEMWNGWQSRNRSFCRAALNASKKAEGNRILSMETVLLHLQETVVCREINKTRKTHYETF